MAGRIHFFRLKHFTPSDKSDCGDAHNYLKDDVDKLKGDMDKMLDLVKAMQELAGPMGASMMDMRGLADQIASCCSG